MSLFYYIVFYLITIHHTIDIDAFQGKILDTDKIYPKFGDVYNEEKNSERLIPL